MNDPLYERAMAAQRAAMLAEIAMHRAKADELEARIACEDEEARRVDQMRQQQRFAADAFSELYGNAQQAIPPVLQSVPPRKPS